MKGHVVYKENNSIKKGIELFGKPILRFPGKTPSWRDACPMSLRYGYMIAMSSLRDFKTVAFTINLSPSTETAIRRQGSLDYPRDELSRVLATYLPSGTPRLFFCVAEESSTGRLHLHGAYAIPKCHDFRYRIDNISEALAKKLASKYRQRYSNKRIDVKTEYKRMAGTADEHDNVTIQLKVTDINCGWMGYCSKHHGALEGPGLLNKEIVVSQGLRQLTKAVWKVLWNLSRGRDAGVRIINRTADQIRHAMSAKRPAPTISTHNAYVIPLEKFSFIAPRASEKKSIFSGFRLFQWFAACLILLTAALPPATPASGRECIPLRECPCTRSHLHYSSPQHHSFGNGRTLTDPNLNQC